MGTIVAPSADVPDADRARVEPAAAGHAGHTKTCGVCGNPFKVPPSVNLSRCPDCRAAGRTHCFVCQKEVQLSPGSPARALCLECRKARRGRTFEPRLPRQQRPCAVCHQPFDCPQSSKFVRCPACRTAGRFRCASCKQEVAASPKNRGPVLCEACRALRRTRAPRARPARSEYITPRCRGYVPFGSHPTHARTCARTRTDTAARWGRSKSYEPETGTYVCSACQGAAQMIKFTLVRLKDLGYGERITSWKHLREIQRLIVQKDPKWKANRSDLSEVTMKKAHQAARESAGRPSPGRAYGKMVETWQRDNTRRIDLCRWCDRLLMYSTDGKRIYLHRPCWDEATSTPEGRRWLSAWTSARRSGLTRDECDKRIGPHPPMPKRQGRRPQVETLTRTFGWAVRYVLGGESQQDLAHATSCKQPVVARAIRDILLRLPPNPQRVERTFRRYVLALRQAAEEANA